MRMTAHKKEILTDFEPDNLEWMTGEVGAPPLDVSGVTYLHYGLLGSTVQLRDTGGKREAIEGKFASVVL